MVTSRPRLADAQAALWTIRCRVQCRRQLDRQDVRSIVLPPSSGIPAGASRVVSRLLRRRQNQCLSNALIVQAWRADHGDEVDVVIGVTAPSAGFSAHAWLADAPEAAAAGHQPIYRLPPHRQLSTTRG
jgi:Transglutaminase-like superfamily